MSVTLKEEYRSDANRRFVVGLQDGTSVEAVLYRENTLCVSCQVGCAVGCPFCASGAFGLGRQLTLEEMTGQLDLVEALGVNLKRVTVSGVGEPLHNHRVVAQFIRTCRSRQLGPSLTTSGGPILRLKEWLHLPHNGLTISVHAGTEAVRAKAVPKGPPLADLFDVLNREVPTLSRSRRKKVALAYLMIADLNDSDEELDAFIARVRPLSLNVHLYAYNPVPTSPLQAVSRARYEAAYRRIKEHIPFVRMSSKARTEDNGGCGTLIALRRVDRLKSPVR